jgi:cytochrome c5
VSKEDDVFIREFGVVLGALFLFFLLALIVARGIGAAAHQQSQLAPGEVAKRIQPVGEVRVGEPGQVAEAPAAQPAVEVAAAAMTGDAVYQSACIACHASGAAGAPKMGDAAAWGPRVTQGLATLIDHAINGKGVMPPRGGNPALTDADIENAIKYMLEQTGVSAN